MLQPKEYRESCTAVLRYRDGRIEELPAFPGVPQFMNTPKREGGFMRFELVWLSGDRAVYQQLCKGGR